MEGPGISSRGRPALLAGALNYAPEPARARLTNATGAAAPERAVGPGSGSVRTARSAPPDHSLTSYFFVDAFAFAAVIIELIFEYSSFVRIFFETN